MTFSINLKTVSPGNPIFLLFTMEQSFLNHLHFLLCLSARVLYLLKENYKTPKDFNVTALQEIFLELYIKIRVFLLNLFKI